MEGLWLALLRRTSLIDDLTSRCVEGQRVVEVSLVPLAQFRDKLSTSPTTLQQVKEESYTITWTLNGEPLKKFTNQTKVVMDGGADAAGVYKVKIELFTPEVRVDVNKLLTAQETYRVSKACSEEADGLY